MTGIIKLTVIDDDRGSGIPLTAFGGTTLPPPGSYVTVIGKCIDGTSHDGESDHGSHIVNDARVAGGRCELTDGTVLRIKLDIDFTGTKANAYFQQDAPFPAVCISDIKNDKSCEQKYIKNIDIKKHDQLAVVTLNNISGTGFPKYYRLNFYAPISGTNMPVTLDPKIINKPRLEIFALVGEIGAFLIAFLAISLTIRSFARRARARRTANAGRPIR